MNFDFFESDRTNYCNHMYTSARKFVVVLNPNCRPVCVIIDPRIYPGMFISPVISNGYAEAVSPAMTIADVVNDVVLEHMIPTGIVKDMIPTGIVSGLIPMQIDVNESTISAEVLSQEISIDVEFDEEFTGDYPSENYMCDWYHTRRQVTTAEEWNRWFGEDNTPIWD